MIGVVIKKINIFIKFFRLCKVKQKAMDFLFAYSLCYTRQEKERTKPTEEDIVYSLHHLYFSSGLSLRNTAIALLSIVHKRSHTTAVAVRDYR